MLVCVSPGMEESPPVKVAKKSKSLKHEKKHKAVAKKASKKRSKKKSSKKSNKPKQGGELCVTGMLPNSYTFRHTWPQHTLYNLSKFVWDF